MLLVLLYTLRMNITTIDTLENQLLAFVSSISTRIPFDDSLMCRFYQLSIFFIYIYIYSSLILNGNLNYYTPIQLQYTHFMIVFTIMLERCYIIARICILWFMLHNFLQIRTITHLIT